MNFCIRFFSIRTLSLTNICLRTIAYELYAYELFPYILWSYSYPYRIDFWLFLNSEGRETGERETGSVLSQPAAVSKWSRACAPPSGPLCPGWSLHIATPGPTRLSSFNSSISVRKLAKVYITMAQGGELTSSRDVEGRGCVGEGTHSPSLSELWLWACLCTLPEPSRWEVPLLDVKESFQCDPLLLCLSWVDASSLPGDSMPSEPSAMAAGWQGGSAGSVWES